MADALATTINAHGRDAVAVYLGNPNVHSLGSMTHGTALVKALGTRNRYSATSVDQLPHQLLAHLMFGHQLMLPVPDLDRTSYFLVFGANPVASHGSLMTVPDFPRRLRDLRARGGRMVVVDPRRTETAKAADEHVFVRPGTDAPVLLAMLHVLFADDLVVSGSPCRRTPTGWRPSAWSSPPSPPSARRRPPGSRPRRSGGWHASWPPPPSAVAYGRVGISSHPHGSVCVWALTLLNVLTGNLDREGGAMFTSPAIDLVGTGLIGRGHVDRWRSRVRDLPEVGGELPVAALREEIETPGEGQVRTLLTVAGNPVLSTPDGAALDRALPGLEFRAAVDLYVNETTRHADVILPPTTLLERDHYDLVFHTLAVRNTARFTPAALPKDPDARHDWEIFRELALRTLARLDRKPALGRRLTLQARMRLSPRTLIAGLLRRGRSGVTLRRLLAEPSGVDLGPLQAGRLPAALRTRDRRLRLAPDLVLADVRRLDDAAVPDADQLLLIGRRHQRDCNSWLHNSPRLVKGRPRHQLLMHPDDLADRGLADGARVRVASRVGSVETEVSATDTVMPGVVSLPHGFGHGMPGSQMARAAEVEGVSINDLTDTERLDVSGNAAFSGTPVTVVAAG